MEGFMRRVFAYLLTGTLFLCARPILAQAIEEEDSPLSGEDLAFDQAALGEVLPDFQEAPDPKPILARLNLSDQQKKQVEQMRFDMQKQLIGVRSKMQTARLELRQLLAADNPDKAAIEAKMGEISKIALQVHSIRLNEWFEVNKILNPDQQKVWRDFLKLPLRDRARAWMRGRFNDVNCPCMRGSMMGGRVGRGRGPHGMMMEHMMLEKKMEQEKPEKK
jgi:Spy/CpxP family protein refolding chaperone